VFRRLWDKIKLLWKLAKSERATPREIFWAVFVGVFAGCTPAVGIHGPLSLGLATLFRKNRLFAWLGSRISNMVFLPFIAISEIQLSHRVRTGDWLALDREHVLDKAHELLLDWCLGTVPVGCALGLVVGAAAYWFATRRDRRRRIEEAARPSPSERPPRSSGSPA
jgi:uncharacterized protein (DUF2062 family)